MKKDPDKSLYRILDVNFNRSKEGLRVCEDLCRYIWNQRTLTRAFKDVRHEFRRDTRAIIRYLDEHLVGRAAGLDADLAAGLGVFRRVGQHVDQRLHQARLVADQVQGLVAGRE